MSPASVWATQRRGRREGPDGDLHGDRQQVADDLRAPRRWTSTTGPADLGAGVRRPSRTRSARQSSIKADLESSVSAQQALLDGANSELRRHRRRAGASGAGRRRQAAADAAGSGQGPGAGRCPDHHDRRPDRRRARSGPVGPPLRPSRLPGPGPGPGAPLPVAPVGSGAGAAIAAASRSWGLHRWAGASPSTGFDCSGLTMWAWARGGRSLPHSSSAQYAASAHLARPAAARRPGVLQQTDLARRAGTSVAAGMIHSAHTGDVVKIAYHPDGQARPRGRAA